MVATREITDSGPRVQVTEFRCQGLEIRVTDLCFRFRFWSLSGPQAW